MTITRPGLPPLALALALPLAPACAGDDGKESAGSSASVGSGISGITSITGGSQGSGGSSSGDDSSSGSGGSGSSGSGSSDSQASSESNGDGGGVKFDIGEPHDLGMVDDPCNDTGPDCKCTTPEHMPCDNGTGDPFKAIGLNCPGEPQVTASPMGSPPAIGVRSSFGGTNTFNPREGAIYAVIGSGLVLDLDKETPFGDSNAGPTHCNDALGISLGKTLPAPIKPNGVGGDCIQNPGLIGTGDCSNTIAGQFNQGGSANDYNEMRFVAQVPSDVTSFSYEFAFFSTEWPFYFGSGFNDMYVGWLNSEKWTGNISFDMQGNPISLNAGFLDFQDGNGTLPVFAGTCMRQHAGTNWLKTTAGVAPGETITVIFAVFDLSDQILDSYAFIDNFQWGCEPGGPPQTIPG